MTAAAEVTAILPTIPADTFTSRCEYYRHRCQLDARIRPELQAIIVAASNTLGAITMPAELAARVRLHMQHQGVRLGPIISHPRSNRWTFLVRPDIPADMATFARLFRAQIAVTRPGTEIALPSPVRRHSGFRCWSQPPADAYRPSGAVVLAAVDACGGLGRRAQLARSM
ncbi:DNA-directed RNA polymerase subunit beta [Nocardia vinacea]|uniref:DNA-directed RNA polymerase subunit beta n=1 Tax=Nocardia vinacea TaxID=96468 RepID=UPI0033E8C295